MKPKAKRSLINQTDAPVTYLWMDDLNAIRAFHLMKDKELIILRKDNFVYRIYRLLQMWAKQNFLNHSKHIHVR